MLSKRCEFRMVVVDEGIEVIQDSITNDTPPGIDPIPDAKVLRLEPVALSEAIEMDGEEMPMITAIVEMSVESFIRNSIQYGIDSYDILQQVKEDCGADMAAAAMKFLQETTDLTVAVISAEGVDQWPKTPEL